jgi:DNA-binding response OmpR family regulator
VARVLISESSPDVRKLLMTLVDRMGHEGVIADSVDRALVEGADVLLVEPGGRSSLVFAQRVRTERPELPIICISIYPPSAESRLLRPVAHLIKPFTLAELEAAIDSALGRASPITADAR